MSDAGGVLHPWWQLQDRSEHRLMPTAFVDQQLVDLTSISNIFYTYQRDKSTGGS